MACASNFSALVAKPIWWLLQYMMDIVQTRLLTSTREHDMATVTITQILLYSAIRQKIFRTDTVLDQIEGSSQEPCSGRESMSSLTQRP